MQLQRISTKTKTLVKDEVDFKSVPELFGTDSINLTEMTKAVTAREEEIAKLRIEKDSIAKKCLVANQKTM